MGGGGQRVLPKREVHVLICALVVKTGYCDVCIAQKGERDGCLVYIRSRGSSPWTLKGEREREKKGSVRSTMGPRSWVSICKTVVLVAQRSLFYAAEICAMHHAGARRWQTRAC